MYDLFSSICSRMKTILFGVISLLLVVSCNSYKKIVYLQNAGEPINLQDSTMAIATEPDLKAGDLLVITVNSPTPELSLPFNLPLVPGGKNLDNYDLSNTPATGGATGLQNYLVDTQGNIVFPIIGSIHVVGMTKSQLAAYIKQKIHPAYIKEEPVVVVRFSNYSFSVLGEVTRPNVYTVENEKVSILEALAMAGDLTVYGQRKNILLIREAQDGKRHSYRIDLTDQRLIGSSFYYLQQKDVIYVMPNSPKARSSFFSTAEGLSVSVLGILISLSSLIITVLK
jgi:polysaccharide export outer membrane protein